SSRTFSANRSDPRGWPSTSTAANGDRPSGSVPGTHEFTRTDHCAPDFRASGLSATATDPNDGLNTTSRDSYVPVPPGAVGGSTITFHLPAAGFGIVTASPTIGLASNCAFRHSRAVQLKTYTSTSAPGSIARAFTRRRVEPAGTLISYTCCSFSRIV